MTRSAPSLLLVALALLIAGCGGPPEISKVESCLKDAGLVVERPEGAAKRGVNEGISARTKADERDLTLALAAVAKRDSDVKQFHEDFAKTKDGLSDQQEQTFAFASGSDERYVWAVAGIKGSSTYDDAVACVEA